MTPASAPAIPPLLLEEGWEELERNYFVAKAASPERLQYARRMLKLVGSFGDVAVNLAGYRRLLTILPSIAPECGLLAGACHTQALAAKAPTDALEFERIAYLASADSQLTPIARRLGELAVGLQGEARVEALGMSIMALPPTEARKSFAALLRLLRKRYSTAQARQQMVGSLGLIGVDNKAKLETLHLLLNIRRSISNNHLGCYPNNHLGCYHSQIRRLKSPQANLD
jgi:hypothetical protein